MKSLLVSACVFLALIGLSSNSFAIGNADSLSLVPDSMKSKQNVLPLNLPPDRYAALALSSNPFVYDRLISPFSSDSIYLPNAGEYRFGLNSYRQFRNIHLTIPELDTNLSVTNLRVLLGSKREQLLFLNHHQRLSKRMTGALSYNNIVSPGFLLNSLARYRRLYIDLNYESKFFNSSFDFSLLKIKADENGGILPNQKLEGLSKSDFEQLRTFLPDDSREVRESVVNWKNVVMLFNSAFADDSTSSFKLNFQTNGSYHKFGSVYNGTSDSLYYVNEYLDSLTTKDTAGYSYFVVNPGLSFEFQNESFHAWVKTGWSKYFLENKIDSVEGKNDYDVVDFLASIENKSWFISSQYHRVMSTFANDQDFSFSVDARIKFESKLLSAFSLSTGSSELAPEATNQFYISNHFIWNNSFRKEKFTWIKPSLELLNHRLRFYASRTIIENYVYYNDQAVPQQGKESVEIFNTGLQTDVSIGHWRMMGDARWNKTSKGYVRLPEMGLYGRISYRALFFKKALFAEFGVAFATQTEWKGYAYMPATGALYLQSNQFVGGSPSMDVFINADIGRATITIMMQRINNSWFGGEYLLAPGYPAPPNTLKFGVFWKLYN